jgi:integrase
VVRMVTRRERGDGSLTFDAAANRWAGRLDTGRGADGRRVRVKVTGRTRAEARAKLDELRRERERGLDVTTRATTFETLAALWLDRGLPADTSDTTRDNYRSLVRTHLLPRIGHRRLIDLRPEHLEDLLAEMASGGYAGRTMRLVANLCGRILVLGMNRGLLARNVASVVQVPRGPRAERHGLTVEQARALLSAAREDPLGNLVTVSLLLGLRPGEAAGLTWDCVQLDRPQPILRVERSLRRTAAGMVLVAPKTATSRRSLALPGAAVEALLDQRQRRGAHQQLPDDVGLVFSSESGTPLDPSNVRRALARIARNAGLEHVHPHLLRHATASLLSAAGVSLEDISDTLGHKSVNVTAEIYRHPIAPVRSGHQAAMSALTVDDGI